MNPCQEAGSCLLPLFSLLPPEAHARRRAAVGIENLSCDEVRGVRDEEGDRRAYVLRTPDAAPRDEGVPELRGVARVVEVAGDLDDAGADGVYPNPLVGELYRELTGEGVRS